MGWFLIALAVLLAGGFLSLAVGKSPKAACLIGMTATLLGGGVALFESLRVLLSGQSQVLRLAWPLPLSSLGSANMEIDPLSAVFAVAIALVTMLAAVYGSEYLQSRAGRKKQNVSPLPLGEGQGVRAASSPPPVLTLTLSQRERGPMAVISAFPGSSSICWPPACCWWLWRGTACCSS